MVSPVDQATVVSRLAALMRSAAHAERAVAGRDRKALRPPQGRAAPNAAAPGWTPASQEAHIAALDTDPQRRRRTACRLLVEALLARELGGAMGSDPGFQSLVDDVSEALLGSALAATDLDAVIDGLLRDR